MGEPHSFDQALRDVTFPLSYTANSAGTKAKDHRRAQRDSTGVWWWSKQQAEQLGANQLAQSACGPTAILNVLRLLEYRVRAQNVLESVPARLRDYKAPLLPYLQSRAKAGTTHADLVGRQGAGLPFGLTSARVQARACLSALLL